MFIIADVILKAWIIIPTRGRYSWPRTVAEEVCSLFISYWRDTQKTVINQLLVSDGQPTNQSTTTAHQVDHPGRSVHCDVSTALLSVFDNDRWRWSIDRPRSFVSWPSLSRDITIQRLTKTPPSIIQHRACCNYQQTRQTDLHKINLFGCAPFDQERPRTRYDRPADRLQATSLRAGEQRNRLHCTTTSAAVVVIQIRRSHSVLQQPKAPFFVASGKSTATSLIGIRADHYMPRRAVPKRAACAWRANHRSGGLSLTLDAGDLARAVKDIIVKYHNWLYWRRRCYTR